MAYTRSAVGALEGLRVVDFGQYLSAPMVTMFLADNGADVIHIDPPEGVMWDHPANAALLRGKRSISLDLKREAGRREALRLVLSADVVVENFRPGVMERLGLDPRTLREENERLIWCSIPGFAADDPRAGVRAWEGVVCSAAGLYPPANFAQGDPIFTALPLASNFGAFLASHRIAAALLQRLRSGVGQQIEVSLFEACFQGIGLYAEFPPSRDLSGTLLDRVHSIMKTRRAADGTYLYFDSPLRGLQAFLDRFLPGHDLRTCTDDDLATVSQRLDSLILEKNGAEWERICQEEIKGAFGLVQSLPAWLSDRHALESETILEIDDPILGATAQPGYPVLLSQTRPSVRWARGVMDPGEGEEIQWLGPIRMDPTPEPDSKSFALSGLRVLDCSTLLAGPTSGRILAQYGAEVIKLDRAGIGTGDIDPLSDDEFAFIGLRTVSAGKRMMYVDLKTVEGQEILSALVRTADVVHHNFTPDAATRLGLSETQLRAVRRDVIVSTMSLHSQGGFRAEYRGHDMLGQVITGMGHRAGGTAEPQVVSTVLNDNAAGHLHAFGIILALLHRYRSGEGQAVNSSLSRTATLHQVPFMIGFSGRTWNEPAGRDAPGWHTFDRLYRARDGWLYLSSGQMDGLPMLKSVPFLAGITTTSQDELDRFLAREILTRTVSECVSALNRAGFSAHRHMTLNELAADEYVMRRDLLSILQHPGIGPALGIGLHLYASCNAQRAELLVGRSPGMDTIQLLVEHGFGDRIGDLLRAGIVAVGERSILNTPSIAGFWDSADSLRQARMAGILPNDELIEQVRRTQRMH